MKEEMFRVGKALRAWQRGDNLSAIRHLRRLVRRFDDHVDYWAALGDLEHQEELYAAAVASYRRALAALASGRGRRVDLTGLGQGPPREASIWRALGSALGGSGAMDEAEEALRRAVELEPIAGNLVALGELLELTGRRAEALRAFRRALRHSPDHVETLYRIACWHLWTAPVKAERYLRRVLERDGRHAMALSAMGFILGARHDWEASEDVLRKAARYGGAGALPHVYLGHNAWHQGRAKQAEACYRRGMREAPEDPHPHFALGDLYRHLERLDDARGAYETALRIDPRCGDALLRLGYLHEEAGRADEAAECLRRGLEFAPQHPWSDDVRRVLREQAGDGAEA